MRPDEIDKPLVGRVGEIGVAVGFRGEGDEEAVRQPLLEAFRGIVGAPLEALDLLDPFREPP